MGLAELGDKTMLLALALAVKYRPSTVLIGLFTATALLMLLPVAVGGFVFEIVPVSLLGAISGVIFIAFGLWMFIGNEEEEGDEELKTRFGPLATVIITFVLAEFGDKTQLATVPLAAKYGNSLVLVWLGATLGMAGVNVAGIFIGNKLREKIDRRLIEKAAGSLFILFGVVLLAGAAL